MGLKHGNLTKIQNQNLCRWELVFLKIGEIFKNRKNINIVIREKINIINSVLDYIRYKQLNWNGHVQRMEEERLPRKILEWCPTGRRKGRSRNSCMQEETTGMREKGWNGLTGKNGEGK